MRSRFKLQKIHRLFKNLVMVNSVCIGFVLPAISHATLNLTTQNLINQAYTHRAQATQAQKESYYFNLGVAYVTNPIAIGKAIFEAKNTNFSVAKFAKPTAFAFTCKLEEPTCIQAIITETTTPPTPSNTNMATDNDFILNRYYQFLQNPPAVTLAEYTITAPSPNYTYFTLGQRLDFIKNLQLAQSGKANTAMQNSFATLAKLRKQLVQADTLLGKMVMLNLVINQLQQIVVLKQQFDFSTIYTTASPAIMSLTDAEKDLSKAFLSEFIDLKITLENAIKTLTPAEKLLYKQDDTFNAMGDFIIEQIKISHLPAPEFAKYRQQNAKIASQDYAIKLNKTTNYIGHILTNIAIPEYQVYSERVMAVDNLITITNFVLSEKKSPLKNTFAPTVTKVMQDNDKICMAMPTLDLAKNNNGKYGCLIVKKFS